VRKKILPAFLIFFFSVFLYGQTIYEEFDRFEKLIQEKKPREAAEILEKSIASGKKEFLDKKIYLLAWAYSLEKNYSQTLLNAKKIITSFQDSSYFYPSLFLYAYISYRNQDKEGALKVLEWASKKNPVQEDHLFTLAFLRYIISGQYEENPYLLYSFSPLKLCWISLSGKEKYSVPDEKKPEVKEEKKEEIKEKIEETKKEPEKKKEVKEEVKEEKKQINDEKQKKEEAKTPEEIDILKIKKELERKEKELKLFEALLFEKKRLLTLKEEFLKQKEMIEKKIK